MTVRADSLAEIVKGFSEKVLHFLGRLVQQIIDITQLQRVEPDPDFFGPQYPHLGCISVATEMLTESRFFDLLQRVVFAMRIDHQYRGSVCRRHQLLEQHAGCIALSRSSRSEYRQVSG